VNSLRRHHTAHHNARLMMELNMNLTFPIADWLFGTSDLNRGVIGHLLNGYDTRVVKKDLLGAPRRPDEAAAGPKRPNLLQRPNVVPTDVKAAVSVVALIVAAVVAFWSGSRIGPELSIFVVATAVFMVAAMWIFPEAGVKKGDVRKAK